MLVITEDNDNTLIIPKKYQKFLKLKDRDQIDVTDNESKIIHRLIGDHCIDLESLEDVDVILKIFNKEILRKAWILNTLHIKRYNRPRLVLFDGFIKDDHKTLYKKHIEKYFANDLFVFINYYGHEKIYLHDQYFWDLLHDIMSRSGVEKMIHDKYSDNITKIFMKIYDLLS